MALWPFGAHDREHPSLGTILVIDDEDSVRKISRLTLTKAGYEVLEAANGEEAIQAINTGENPLTVDVILCDIHMPKINGVEVIHYFQTQYPSVQIVVQTGFPDLNLAMSLMKQDRKSTRLNSSHRT